MTLCGQIQLTAAVKIQIDFHSVKCAYDQTDVKRNIGYGLQAFDAVSPLSLNVNHMCVD